jgi:hypothetical protein
VQVDYNGQSESFNWVAVSIGMMNQVAVVVYPNPLSSGPLSLDFENMAGKVNITIYDMAGRELYSRDYTIDKSHSSISLHHNLTKGMYNIV